MVIAHDAMPEPDGGSLIPAHLSYLAIYNPTLGTTDETLEEQIVFYTSGSSDQRPSYLRDVNVERHDSHLLENDKNDMLRQVGLAQGMVSFAKYEKCLSSLSTTNAHALLNTETSPRANL